MNNSQSSRQDYEGNFGPDRNIQSFGKFSKLSNLTPSNIYENLGNSSNFFQNIRMVFVLIIKNFSSGKLLEKFPGYPSRALVIPSLMIYSQVLYLDTGVEKTVTKMRRNLLKLLNVGEFNPAAEWKDPCISFILPEVNF